MRFYINNITDDINTQKTNLNLKYEQLKNETDLVRYLLLLKEFSNRYTVIISSYDTPYGPGYYRELSIHFEQLGLKTDLYGKFRAGYIAIIDEGRVIFEKLSSGDAVRFEGEIGNCFVQTISTGYNSNDWIACTNIDGKDRLVKSRGINFVVFDKITGFILDTVGFDTYSEGIPCMRTSEIVDFINRISRERFVKIVCCKFPKFPTENLTENEQKIIGNPSTNSALLNYYDSNGVNEVTTVPESFYDINGVRRFVDYQSNLLNTVGGHRLTYYQPLSHKRTIYMVGGCRMYGFGSDDSRTVESYLQMLFNKELAGAQIIVQNYGFMFSGLKKDEVPTIIEGLPLQAGDIVLTELNIGQDTSIHNIPVIDISAAFAFPRDFEVFYDTIHYTPDGNRITAQRLFDNIISQNLIDFAPDSANVESDYGFTNSQSKELNKYKSILCEYYEEKFPELIIGSIVMNCNPFTLGHRYLIEKALEQCDFLMIFVVQEDKSIFPFEDRLKLVDECTADIVNKEVIPSGRFIISSLTFSEYFNKSEMQNRTIDTSLDVSVFAREIAPCLHITKRFAGEEPSDSVTRQYNETMAKVLPEYGIEFVEIPRAELEGEVISASHVRELLEAKDFEKIKELVPNPTYNYLIEHFEL